MYVQSISSRDPCPPPNSFDPEGILASFCKTGNVDRYCILQDGMGWDGGFSGGKEQGRGGFRWLRTVFFFFFFFSLASLDLCGWGVPRDILAFGNGWWGWLVWSGEVR